MSAADRVRAYLAAHAASHRNPDVVANLVPDKPDGPVIELRAGDLRELLTAAAASPPARNLAVRCRDGCGWRGRRAWPGPERPCPRCGARVDVGHPEKVAAVTTAGGLGGRTQLVWSDW